VTSFLLALVLLAFGCAFLPAAAAQDSIAGVDLLYPELAHPSEDAIAAIKRRDYRFITINRQQTIVPGVERFPRMVERHGTKFVRQPFRIFATKSQNFSFKIRSRAYAEEYNRTLLRYLLNQPKE
jgi:hypothetical protein